MLTIRRRPYDDYGAYLRHQEEKTRLASLQKRLRRTHEERLASFHAAFRSYLSALLPSKAQCLCLGARRGEEVEALQDLGYRAIGVDLVPHEGLVLQADFHHLPFSARSFDMVFTNSLDHAFSLDRLGREIARVLQPTGVFNTHFTPGVYAQYESLDIPTLVDLAEGLSKHFRLAEQSTIIHMDQERLNLVFRRAPQ